MRESTSVGEWDEALELLAAILRQLQTTVTDDERADLHRIGNAMDLDIHLP